MQTRREQVRAYRFVTRRMVSALLSGEPETTELPMRRLALAMVGSVLVGAIVLAVVGAYGLLNPGGGTPGNNSVVIERETGARYVYTQNTLFPVYNFASALLILGTADPSVEPMSRNSLRGLPRSRQTYGILGEPDSLSDRGALVSTPWTVCSAPRSADSPAPATRLLVGSQPPGGTGLGDSALLVVLDGTDNRYLLWHNRALRIGNGQTLAALGMTAYTPVPVGPALINGTVAGPDLAVPAIDGDGTTGGSNVGGHPAKIGSVYRDDRGQRYVMLSDGLSPVGEAMADLITARGGRQVQPIGAAEAGSLLSSRRMEPDGFPPYLPKIAQPASGQVAVCTAYSKVSDTGTESNVLLYDRVPPQVVPAAGEGSVAQSGAGIRTADSVTVVGQGAVVRSVASPGASGAGNQVYLVTAQGIRYALESRTGDAKAALGYGAVTPAEIPVALLELIPVGPTLDIAVARTPPSQSASGAPAPAAGPSTVEPGPSASRGSPTRTGSPKPGGTTSPTGSP